MKKYLHMTKAEYTLIIKLMLCTILATLFSWAIGDIHNPTTAVTANLCLYTDRGYRGNILYATRRILSQLIQGFLVLLLILPCKYFELPIADGVLIVIACCFAIAVGLPLNYKHPYAPLNCTLANATFIITCSVVQDMGMFPKRILQCLAGALIGYFVNYIVFPYQDREKEILHLADDCLTSLIHDRDFTSFNRSLALLEKEYSFVVADKGKKRRTPLKMTQDEITFLRWNKEALQKLSSFVSAYETYKEQATDECKNIMWELLPHALTIHKLIIAEGPGSLLNVEKVPIPPFKAECHEDLVLLGRLLEYVNLINDAQQHLHDQYSSAASGAPSLSKP